MVRRAPAARAAARLSEPDLPAPPITATTGLVVARPTTRWVRAGAPQTSITDSDSSAGRSSGITAAIERPNSTAYPSHGTCSPSAVPPRQAVLDDQRGQGQRHQRGDPVADAQAERRRRARPPRRCRRACRRSRSRGSASCRGSATMSSTAARMAAPSTRPSAPVCVRSSWRYDAASRLSFCDADPDLVGPQLPAGVQAPCGLGQDHAVVQDAVQTGGITRRSASRPFVLRTESGNDRKSCGAVLDLQDVLCLLCQRRRAPHNRRAAVSHGHTQEQPMSIETAIGLDTTSPTSTGVSSWSSRTGPGSPAGATSPPQEWASVQWQRAALREERPAAARAAGRPARRARSTPTCERDQAERATMSMLVPPQMMNTMVPQRGARAVRARSPRRSTPTRCAAT